MNIHPKTSAAALAGSLGVLIAAVLHSIHGVHLTAEAYAAIPVFLSTVGSWLVPTVTDVTGNQSAKPASVTTLPPHEG